MESYCHDYKEYSMSGVPPTSNYIPVKNGPECDMADKERQISTQYFKPAQPLDSPVYSASPTPAVNNVNSYPKYGTVIPNRIFVGGIDFKTREEDLQKFFCSFGVVRDTKIIRDRADISKGYGFVTFESADEANKVREKEDCLYLNGKKLNIGQAIRKQVCFPKDIHVPGPAGSWIFHPGGYASYTNQNGITYFAPTSVVAPMQQPQAFTHSHLVAYNGTPYQPVANPYASYAYQTQPYNAVHVPWNPAPIAGACGQLIAPTPGHPGVEQVNVVPMATQALTAGSYVIPRTAAVVTPQPAVAPQSVTTRPSEGAMAHQQEKQFIAHQEQPAAQQPTLRMIAPQNVATTYVQQATIQAQQVQPQVTTVYANPPQQIKPVQAAQQHYVGVGEAPQAHYTAIMVPEGAEAVPNMVQGVQGAVKAENEILTPPLTPEQQQQPTGHVVVQSMQQTPTQLQAHPAIAQQQ